MVTFRRPLHQAPSSIQQSQDNSLSGLLNHEIRAIQDGLVLQIYQP